VRLCLFSSTPVHPPACTSEELSALIVLRLAARWMVENYVKLDFAGCKNYLRLWIYPGGSRAPGQQLHCLGPAFAWLSWESD
jgi:hypothetical protein